MVVLFVVLAVDEVEELRGGRQQSLHKPVAFFIVRSIAVDQRRSLLSALICGIIIMRCVGGGGDA